MRRRGSPAPWRSVLLLLACNGPDTPALDPLVCTGTVSPAIATVIGVRFDAPAGATSSVEFGESDAYGLTTPTTDAAEVHLDLVGVPEDTDVYWRATATTSDGTATCTGMTRTGDLPSGIPELTVEVDAEGQDPAPYVIGAFFLGAGGFGSKTQLAAFRRDGTVVWAFESEEDSTGMDLHYAQDGSGILFNSYGGPMGGEEGILRRMTLAGEITQQWDVPLAHHMFAELPDGTLAIQQVDIRPYTYAGDTEDWVGDAIAEVPAGGGDAKPVFSVWDALTPTFNDEMERSIYAGLDWTHGNMVTYDAAHDSYLLSLGHATDILEIDRASGEVTRLWGLDGAPASPMFDYQHDVHWLPSGNLLMFTSTDSGAGAIEYAVADDGLTEVWRGPMRRKPFALGQARRLGNGNTFVNGGAGNSLYEVTPEGDIVWEVSTTGGPAVFAQFQPVDDLYTGALAQ